jgi:hypothetical protein
MTVSPRDALPIDHELVAEFEDRNRTESTVICQVLAPEPLFRPTKMERFKRFLSWYE